MTRLVLPLPLASLTRGGLLLSGGRLLTDAELAGAQVLAPTGGLVRIESRHRYLSSVAKMEWSEVTEAGSALLMDGRSAILLWSSLERPVAEVVALPTLTGRDRKAAADCAAFTLMFGRELANRAAIGSLLVADGDLAWLDERLNPASEHYFRAQN